MKDLPNDKICDLYVKKGLSSTRIAEMFGCCKATILKRLRLAKVDMRDAGVPRLRFSDEQISAMYLNKKLSSWRIAELLGCGRSTIHRKLRKMKIARDISSSHVKYSRHLFSGDASEKAYLIGFTIGDLRVRKVGKQSKTIKVDCGSTKEEQISLIRNLFRPYGRVWVSKTSKSGKVQIEAFLDDSFSFLLKCRDNLGWALTKTVFFPFLAGFTDAEGSIFITNNKACFSLGNYDAPLLRRIKKILECIGIVTGLYRARKRYRTKDGYLQSKHYWHLAIHRKDSLLKLFNLLLPYLRHKKRRSDLFRAINNIQKRTSKKGDSNKKR